MTELKDISRDNLALALDKHEVLFSPARCVNSGAETMIGQSGELIPAAWKWNLEMNIGLDSVMQVNFGCQLMLCMHFTSCSHGHTGLSDAA